MRADVAWLQKGTTAAACMALIACGSATEPPASEPSPPAAAEPSPTPEHAYKAGTCGAWLKLADAERQAQSEAALRDARMEDKGETKRPGFFARADFYSVVSTECKARKAEAFTFVARQSYLSWGGR